MFFPKPGYFWFSIQNSDPVHYSVMPQHLPIERSFSFLQPFSQLIYVPNGPFFLCQCCQQRVALPDTHGPADLLRDDDAAEAEHFDFTPAEDEFRNRNVGAIL